jgi:putative transcriptional regulator
VRRPSFRQVFERTLCLFVCLWAAVWSAAAEDATHLTSIVIVARNQLPDPFFSESIVLVMNDLAPGPVGLIINRPTQVPVSRLFPELKSLQAVHDPVFFGGPVDPQAVWFLFRAAKAPDHAVKACDGVYLSADRDLLLRLLNREKPMEDLKIIAGHAGWAPGQLEAEIGNGDWSSKRADFATIFKPEHQHPWPPKHLSGESI